MLKAEEQWVREVAREIAKEEILKAMRGEYAPAAEIAVGGGSQPDPEATENAAKGNPPENPEE